MSAHPPQSTSLSRSDAAEPAAAASPAAAGSKRRASDDAQPNATEHQHPSASPMDDTAPVTAESSVPPSSMDLAAAQRSAPAVFSAHSTSAATRKKQRLAPSAAAAAPAVVAPPWSTLYSDALHSIFKFASLANLTRLMSVSRRWGAAVLTMPPVSVPAFIGSATRVDGLLDSRVRRHVTALLPLGAWKDSAPYRLSATQLQRASVQAPWLRELAVTTMDSIAAVQLVSGALPRFPNLCHLDVALSPRMPAAARNRIVERIGALNPATMHTLTLGLPKLADQVPFAPLLALTQLRLFSVGWSGYRRASPPTDAQIRDLRAMTSLQKLTTPYDGDDQTQFFVRMLQPGHALQWTELDSCYVYVTEPLAALLGSLPTLTSLNAWLRCADVNFFSQLTRLSDLKLHGAGSRVDPAALASSLRHCSHLTRLRLSSVDLASRHMEELLSAFPRLSNLSLSGLNELESLRCLSTPSLAASLTSLTLHELPLCLPSELSHLFGLQSLLSVDVSGLALPLTEEDKAAFRVPSQVFPVLHSSDLS